MFQKQVCLNNNITVGDISSSSKPDTISQTSSQAALEQDGQAIKDRMSQASNEESEDSWYRPAKKRNLKKGRRQAKRMGKKTCVKYFSSLKKLSITKSNLNQFKTPYKL